jgi:hypothetical protein
MPGAATQRRQLLSLQGGPIPRVRAITAYRVYHCFSCVKRCLDVPDFTTLEPFAKARFLDRDVEASELVVPLALANAESSAPETRSPGVWGRRHV